MSRVMITILLCVVALAGVPFAYAIDSSSGEVTAISGNVITVSMEGPCPFKDNDTVDVTYMAGIMEMSVGTYTITRVTRNSFSAEAIASSMPPSAGMKIKINPSSIYVGKMPVPTGTAEVSTGVGSVAQDSGMPAEYFQDTKGPSALSEAAALNDRLVAERLIRAGADVNAKDAQGDTALHLTRSVDVVRLLVDAGADVNARNTEFGMTPIFNKDAESARILIEAGADINARSKDLNTPVIWYAYSNYVEGVRALVSAGADVNAVNKDGHTALDIAEEFASEDVADYLRSIGAKNAKPD